MKFIFPRYGIYYLVILFERSIRTATHYQRARLSIHGEVPQLHGTFGLDGEPVLRDGIFNKVVWKLRSTALSENSYVNSVIQFYFIGTTTALKTIRVTK